MQITHTADDGLLPAPWFGKLLLVSLFVMLNLPAIFTGTTGMDPYGFFTLEPVSERPWPLILAVLVSSGSALTGYAIYCLLRRKQTWFAGNRYGAFHRGALLFGVPVGIAYAPLFLLTGYNDKPTALALAGIMSTCLCITAALNDRETHIDPVMARIWFVSCVAFILVFLVLCVLAMLVMYIVEQTPSTGNFFWTWEFSWSDLGYPAEEFSQRHRNGLLAFTLAGSCYMTVAIGGSLLGAILAWAKAGPQGGREQHPTRYLSAPRPKRGGTGIRRPRSGSARVRGLAERRRNPDIPLPVREDAGREGEPAARLPAAGGQGRRVLPLPAPADVGGVFPSGASARGPSCFCASTPAIRGGASPPASWKCC